MNTENKQSNGGASDLSASSGSNSDDCTDPNATGGVREWQSRYKVVGRKTPQDLELAVGMLIGHGFIPLGGLCVFREYKDGQIYAQAMLKS